VPPGPTGLGGGFEPAVMAQDLATSVELLAAAIEAIPPDRLDQLDGERLIASLDTSFDVLRRIRRHLRRRSDHFDYSKEDRMMSHHSERAVELLDRAKEEPGNPAASTLALIGIGNALLEIADQFEYIVDRYQMGAIVESLETIAFNSGQRPQGWGAR
jgi:hypothetical protein